MSAALAIRFGQRVTVDEVDQLIHALDKAFLLENDRFLEAQEAALQDYRQAPFRSPLLAGVSYPADSHSLEELLQELQDDS